MSVAIKSALPKLVARSKSNARQANLEAGSSRMWTAIIGPETNQIFEAASAGFGIAQVDAQHHELRYRCYREHARLKW